MLRSSRRALLSSGFRPQFNRRNVISRNIATTQTASGDASNLPLAGIKVLDMTRVLAGVSCAVFCGMDEAYYK
jgi:succinate--hydroxymethylglutarate CoA-transferase